MMMVDWLEFNGNTEKWFCANLREGNRLRWLRVKSTRNICSNQQSNCTILAYYVIAVQQREVRCLRTSCTCSMLIVMPCSTNLSTCRHSALCVVLYTQQNASAQNHVPRTRTSCIGNRSFAVTEQFTCWIANTHSVCCVRFPSDWKRFFLTVIDRSLNNEVLFTVVYDTCIIEPLSNCNVFTNLSL